MNTNDHAFEGDELVPVGGFDFDSLDDSEKKPRETAGETADAIVEVLAWCATQNYDCSMSIRDQYFAKTLIILFNMRPGELDLRDGTLTELANRYGWKKQKLSILNTEFRERFGIVTRSMKSQTARDAYSARFRRQLLTGDSHPQRRLFSDEEIQGTR